jgi:hypothetical protein
MSDLTFGAHGAELRDEPRAAKEREREETVSVAATSLAAVATAWSAFQAALFSGQQTFALARAGKARELSTQARSEGDQLAHMDANLFVAYAGAVATDNHAFAQFLYDRFPARLRNATDAWLATKPLTTPGAPPHPLAMKEYRVDELVRARELGEQADAEVQKGQLANVRSDTYVLGTVVFATIILLASLALRLKKRGPRRLMLMVAVVALLVSLGWVATEKVAWIG